MRPASCSTLGPSGVWSLITVQQPAEDGAPSVCASSLSADFQAGCDAGTRSCVCRSSMKCRWRAGASRMPPARRKLMCASQGAPEIHEGTEPLDPVPRSSCFDGSRRGASAGGGSCGRLEPEEVPFRGLSPGGGNGAWPVGPDRPGGRSRGVGSEEAAELGSVGRDCFRLQAAGPGPCPVVNPERWTEHPGARSRCGRESPSSGGKGQTPPMMRPRGSD